VRRGSFLVALFLAALTLRAQLVGIGPLLPLIKTDLGVSHAVAGLLGTIPVLCMGVFAPPAAYVAARLGARNAVGAMVLIIGVAGVFRAVAPGAPAVILLTIPIGMGMGLAGAMLPVTVKERFPDRPGFATGCYVAGMTISSALSAALAIPLAHLGSGWRTPLLVYSAVSIALGVVWFVLTRKEPRHERVAAKPLRLPLRNPLAWRFVAAFFFMSSVFYGLNAWLPDAYVERGWSDSSAGDLLAILNTINIPAGFCVAWAADRWGQRRLWLAGAATGQFVGLVGILTVPSAGYLWAVVLGFAIGPLFPLTMTMPLDASDGPAEVASYTGMMLGVGYTLAAASPLVLGAVRDATGGFEAVLVVLVALALLQVLADISLTPARLAAARSSPRRPAPAAST
jgi:CP family cyanate transporter-like MFS transporter